MTPKTRGAAITAKCRDCIHDPAAAGTWREQVGVCSATSCPLWAFRPLPANAPEWMVSRDPADVPEGWAGLHHAEAIRRLRGASIADKADGLPVQAHGGPRAVVAMGQPSPEPDSLKNGYLEAA